MRKRVLLIVVALACLVPAAPAVARTWVISGAGWGHGVGMSQYGAKGYADAGWGYADILKHYYKGVSVAASPSLVPSGIRVGLLQNVNPVHLTGNGPYEFLAGGNVVATGGPGQSWQVASEATGYTLRRDGTVVASALPSPIRVRFEELRSRLQVAEANHWYAYGTLEIAPTRTVLDIPSLEKYLYGLGEVPSSWHVEALKAQATAARTYAADKIRRLGQHRSACDCALYASTLDQAYVGYDKEAGDSGGRWRSAVDATARVLAIADGQPIQAFYASSSGGATENNENVWGGSAISYLRGVPDAGDLRASPFIGWKSAYAQSDIDNRLNADSSTAVGSLASMDVLDPVGYSRRATGAGGVRLRGTSGTKTVSGDKVRSTLGLRSTLFQPGPLAYDGHFVGGVYVAGFDGMIVTGAGATGGPDVRLQRDDGTLVKNWFAYDGGFSGGVRVAAGDLAGDAAPEIVTGPGPGGGPNVRVWSQSGQRLANWYAFEPEMNGGISVAVANKLVVVGGGGRVRMFTMDGRLVREFVPYPGYPGQVRVGAGQINRGTPNDEIVTTPGPGGGPHLKIYSLDGAFLGEFGAYSWGFTGGVWVASGDLDGNGESEIITGADEGGGPHVKAFRGDAAVVKSFYATTGSFGGGIRVAGLRGTIVTGLGPGWWPLFRTWT